LRDAADPSRAETCADPRQTHRARVTVFFVVELKSRAVHIAGIRVAPDGAWMKQIARNLLDPVDGFLRHATHLIHDCDPLFTEAWTSAELAFKNGLAAPDTHSRDRERPNRTARRVGVPVWVCGGALYWTVNAKLPTVSQMPSGVFMTIGLMLLPPVLSTQVPDDALAPPTWLIENDDKVTVCVPIVHNRVFAPAVQVRSNAPVQPVVPSGLKVPPLLGTAAKTEMLGLLAAAPLNHRFNPNP
jgi:hypothetical protein